LIQDKAARENYSADLGKTYRKIFPIDDSHRLLSTQGEFDSSKPGTGDALDAQVNVTCSIKPQAILFAGRSHELEILIRALAGRWCADDTPVTIVTGDDATQLSAPRDPNHNSLWPNQRNIQVFYSTFATPQTWTAYPDSISKATSDEFGDC